MDDQSLEGLKVQHEVPTTLLQGLAGAVLLVGAYFSWRQLHIAREGQVTERYTRAIDHLGNGQVDVRLGGIYALERIARDSRADRPSIGEVVTAFIRSHAPWPPRLTGQYLADVAINLVPELQDRAPDVQASLNVLGRGDFADSTGDRPDLHAVDLRRANLRDAHLERAHLRRAHLEDAYLRDAHLEGALLPDVHLEGALLRGAHLEHADLGGAYLKKASLHGAQLIGARLVAADLEGALLGGANLKGADLGGANLNGTDLGGANLNGAILLGANLERAGLGGASLGGAQANSHTRWPAGFDWNAAGVIIV